MENITLHDKSKAIIEEMLTYPEDIEYLTRIFYKNCFSFPEDIELFKKIISLNPNRFSLELNSYIKRNDINIIFIADIVFHTCEQFYNNENKNAIAKGGYYSMIYELPKYTAMLFDKSENHADIRKKCLDMWDLLYQSDIADIRKLTQQIIEL